MFNFAVGFLVCAGCFAFGLLSSSTVKGWFSSAVTTVEADVSSVKAAVTPAPAPVAPPTPPKV